LIRFLFLFSEYDQSHIGIWLFNMSIR